MEQLSVHNAVQDRRAEAIVQALDAGIEVNRRYQFFLWTQGSMQALLPHKVAICGVYERSRKQVRLEVFNSVLLPAPLLALLTDGQSPLMRHVVNVWINSRARPVVIRLSAGASRGIAVGSEMLIEHGYTELLVHGVSRPQRANEIETLFVFASPNTDVTPTQVSGLELLLPQLHSVYLRVQSFERESGDARSHPTFSNSGYASASISDREEQVLCWVREGKSNQEIGQQLGISPLTVKNHVQKILKKLGATNRAQAVALAMSMNLLVRTDPPPQQGT